MSVTEHTVVQVHVYPEHPDYTSEFLFLFFSEEEASQFCTDIVANVEVQDRYLPNQVILDAHLRKVHSSIEHYENSNSLTPSLFEAK